MPFFLGADLGSTKTHVVIADETGCVAGFGRSGPGNHQSAGYDGMLHNLWQGLEGALAAAGLSAEALAGAGFGIAGYDWPSEEPAMLATIEKLGLAGPLKIANDSILGLVAGAQDGWGVALVSGTGCNCRGWDRDHRRLGRVTGYGFQLGEFAGATELVWRAMQLVANEWTRRGPATGLSAALIRHTGARDLADLVEGYTQHRYRLDPQAAVFVFQVAREGDSVARDLIRWAGVELGEMANAVIRQLAFEELEFDVVLLGSMFDGGPMLIDPLRETILRLAPGARLVRLTVPPVIGAVILGMEQSGLVVTPAVRRNLDESLQALTRLEAQPVGV